MPSSGCAVHLSVPPVKKFFWSFIMIPAKPEVMPADAAGKPAFAAERNAAAYSTVTDLARLRGLSISQ